MSYLKTGVIIGLILIFSIPGWVLPIQKVIPTQFGASSCNLVPLQLQTTCQVPYPKPFVNTPIVFMVDSHPPTSWWQNDVTVFDGNMSVTSNGGTWTFNCETFFNCSEQPIGGNLTLTNLLLMQGVAFGLSVVFKSDSAGNCLPSGTRLFLEWSNANETNGANWIWFPIGRTQNIGDPHARPRMNVLLDCSFGTSYDVGNGQIFNNNTCGFLIGGSIPFTCNNNSTLIQPSQDLQIHSNVTSSVDNIHDPYWCPPGAVGIQNSGCKMRPVAVRAAIIGPAGSTTIHITKIILHFFQQQMANIFIGNITANFFAFAIEWQQMPTFNSNQDFNFDWLAEDVGFCANINNGCSNF